MVHGALALILFVEGEVELVASGDVHMKRNFRVVAVAALLACMVATDALAAGHGGGFGAGGFAGAHMGRGFGGPFPGGITSTQAQHPKAAGGCHEDKEGLRYANCS